MAPKQRTVTVDSHRLRLSKLDKVLFPKSGTTKGAVIEYWQALADVMIPHLTGRPVTRKRWPDGVGNMRRDATSFFRKNLEKSAPTWVTRLAQQHEDHVNVYPVVAEETGQAMLAWFGQVAALELHVPQWRFDAVPATDTDPRPAEMMNPDRLVLDLDPGKGTGLAECAEVAQWCREILDDMGLVSVPVTSGSKGVHLYASLDGSTSSDDISDVAQELAKSLETDHPDEVVSSMRKSERAGKVFIDWSQNNRHKTTVAPYSLRGRAGSEAGPYIAAPRTWEEMASPGLEQLDYKQILERLSDGVEPLTELLGQPEADGDTLGTYRSKRDRTKTSEPFPEASPTRPSDSKPAGLPRFVIQEHHATATHYDTRLERDGVLVSWAVPKGPPLRRDTQRLAVHTEDHPLEYATFEGTIPTGQYGAGKVTIWDSGRSEIEEWQDDKIVAVLHGRSNGGLGGQPRRYALIHTDDDNWIMRLTKAQPDTHAPPPELPSPMLATLGKTSDIGTSGWAFESKWDGYRVLARTGEQLTLTSRTGTSLTRTFPELAELTELTKAGTILDGEVIALNADDRPDFGLLQKRGRLTKKREIDKAAERIPVYYMVFDILYTADHGNLQKVEYSRRREILNESVAPGNHVQVPHGLGHSLAEAMEISQEMHLEGVIAKRSTSIYRPGQRSSDWIKIKHDNHADVVIIGWRQGKGSRAHTFGSLLLGRETTDGTLTYVGRVGTGFNSEELHDLSNQLNKLTRKTTPARDVPDEDAADATWVSPKLRAEVRHSGYTRDDRLRHPVWRTLKSDT